MFKQLALIAFLFPLCFGYTEWSFQIDDNKLLLFNVSGGTPSQKFTIGTFHLGFYHPLRVPDASTTGGIFNPSKSSTWSKTGDSKDRNGTKNGIVGTDTLTITSDLVIKTSEPFEVISNGWEFPGMGTFTLTRSDDGSVAFSDKLLADQKQKLVTLVYDYWSDPSKSAGLTGHFSIGGKPAKQCATVWTMFNETVYEDRTFEQWTVNVTKLTVGKYQASTPGQASFQINDDGIGLPGPVYDSVLEGLDSSDGSTIPCGSNTNITFTLDQNFQINLQPKDFVRQNSDGTCVVAANRLDKGVYGFILPVYVLRDYCLVLDYINKQLGLANRTFN
ncbi:hypothetical protein M3Y97_01000300 [Aphelenchoides bicaudatus]|nr:hypothetical protein M3Y97_01000300 [Aphelenchoides bicaudatus]